MHQLVQQSHNKQDYDLSNINPSICFPCVQCNEYYSTYQNLCEHNTGKPGATCEKYSKFEEIDKAEPKG